MVRVWTGNLRLSRNTGLFLTVGVALGAALALWWYLRTERPAALPTRSVPTAGTFLLRGVPFYRQSDPRWAGRRLGADGPTIARAGAAVCCLSMALALHGFERDPAALNDLLVAADAYVAGTLRWEAVERVTGGRVTARGMVVPTHGMIQAAVRAGRPVAVRIARPSGLTHWVLVVGWRKGDYLVQDPLAETDAVRPLSTYGSPIHALRVVEPVRPGR